MPPFVDLTGKEFVYLTVIERAGHDARKKNIKWKCKCVCGKTVLVNAGDLTTGNTKSCGCLKAPTQRTAKRRSDYVDYLLRDIRPTDY